MVDPGWTEIGHPLKNFWLPARFRVPMFLRMMVQLSDSEFAQKIEKKILKIHYFSSQNRFSARKNVFFQNFFLNLLSEFGILELHHHS